MPKFYFNVNDDADQHGIDLSSVLVAKCKALKMAGQIICHHDADDFWGAGDWTMTVADSSGLMLFRLVLSGIDSPSILRSADL